MGGVDTHQDLHVAAVVDHRGATVATEQFAATRHGYAELITWMAGYGSLKRVGVECTGSYGAGLARAFASRDVAVYEVSSRKGPSSRQGQGRLRGRGRRGAIGLQRSASPGG